jgi:2-phosphosulfolactate phosphatase
MNVKILEFVDGAQRAEGVTVIIDVFRAFSVGCYAFDSGASRIIATSGVDEAFLLKKKYIRSVLVGERNEKIIDGFDFGNSPTEIIKADLNGKTVIHTTTAGTQGLINAVNAQIVITGSLVNAGAVVNYIRAINPESVSLVAMGYRASVSAPEDLVCAEYIKSSLDDKIYNIEEKISELKDSSGKRFFDPANIGFSPPTDFFLCTMLNKFNFILKAERRLDGNIDLMKIDL